MEERVEDFGAAKLPSDAKKRHPNCRRLTRQSLSEQVRINCPEHRERLLADQMPIFLHQTTSFSFQKKTKMWRLSRPYLFMMTIVVVSQIRK